MGQLWKPVKKIQLTARCWYLRRSSFAVARHQRLIQFASGSSFFSHTWYVFHTSRIIRTTDERWIPVFLAICRDVWCVRRAPFWLRTRSLTSLMCADVRKVLGLPLSHFLSNRTLFFRSFVLCGQGSSLLWTPALKPYSGLVRLPRERKGIGRCVRCVLATCRVNEFFQMFQKIIQSIFFHPFIGNSFIS